MVLAHDFIVLITHGLQKILVGLENMPAQIEFNVGVTRVNSIDDAACVVALDFGFCDVVANTQVFHGLAVVAQNGGYHGIHIVGRAIFGAVFDHTAEHITPANGGPHLLEGLLGHVRVAGGAVRVTHQLIAAVFGDFNELFVDADNVTFLVGF